MSSKRLFGSSVVACLALVSCLAHGANVARPTVPGDLEPPSSHKPFLLGHAIGTQNYVCFVNASGVASWVQYGPQAVLFDDRGNQITTHFSSLSPEATPAARPTWQHSRDTSAVWALTPPLVTYGEPDYVEPGAIPWLLLAVAGTSEGPDGGDRLSKTTYIQRVHTSGGVKPTTTCQEGDKAFVPYAADYYFYKAR